AAAFAGKVADQKRRSSGPPGCAVEDRRVHVGRFTVASRLEAHALATRMNGRWTHSLLADLAVFLQAPDFEQCDFGLLSFRVLNRIFELDRTHGRIDAIDVMRIGLTTAPPAKVGCWPELGPDAGRFGRIEIYIRVPVRLTEAHAQIHRL